MTQANGAGYVHKPTFKPDKPDTPLPPRVGEERRRREPVSALRAEGNALSGLSGSQPGLSSSQSPRSGLPGQAALLLGRPSPRTHGSTGRQRAQEAALAGLERGSRQADWPGSRFGAASPRRGGKRLPALGSSFRRSTPTPDRGHPRDLQDAECDVPAIIKNPQASHSFNTCRSCCRWAVICRASPRSYSWCWQIGPR